jgi:hypothetical protein
MSKALHIYRNYEWYIIRPPSGLHIPLNTFFSINIRTLLNGKCGYIDKSDNEIILYKYYGVYVFSDSLARVKPNSK